MCHLDQFCMNGLIGEELQVLYVNAGNMERLYCVIWGNVNGIAQYSWQCNLFYNCIATKWLVSGHRRLCCSVTSSLHLYFGQNKELRGTAAFLLYLHAFLDAISLFMMLKGFIARLCTSHSKFKRFLSSMNEIMWVCGKKQTNKKCRKYTIQSPSKHDRLNSGNTLKRISRIRLFQCIFQC